MTINNSYFISICIPSYNRVTELKRLLNSIDSIDYNTTQIVICEDASPNREQIRKMVQEHKNNTKYTIKYIENEKNLGYDKNLKELIYHADGEYIIFMGDDDVFIPKALDGYIAFLRENRQLGYVLRSYRHLYNNGRLEYFKYYSENSFFEIGIQTYVELFLKSVFISGFTVKTKYAREFSTSQIDGTLLYQLYLLSEVCMKYPSGYYATPITQSFEGGVPFFGSSESEKSLYTPGTITIQNSINFMRGYFKLTSLIDTKYQINSTEKIKINISKYSYPILSIQRDKGHKIFSEYAKELRGLGLNCTFYFEIYYFSLLFFGKKINDIIIQYIKNIIGRRLNL